MGGDHTGRDGDDRSLWTGEAGRPQAGRRSDPEEMLAKVQAAAEEMTMRRYVHMPPEGRPCCPEGCLAALLGELNQIQDHQNQILAELLRALERMADALERR